MDGSIVILQQLLHSTSSVDYTWSYYSTLSTQSWLKEAISEAGHFDLDVKIIYQETKMAASTRLVYYITILSEAEMDPFCNIANTHKV